MNDIKRCKTERIKNVIKTLKVFVTVIGIIFVAANLNLNVSAGHGLGGLAFALAATGALDAYFRSLTTRPAFFEGVRELIRQELTINLLRLSFKKYYCACA